MTTPPYEVRTNDTTLLTFDGRVLELFGFGGAHRLQALLAVPPGAPFTIGDAVFVRTKNATTAGARDEQGTLRHFGQAEHRAFWAWAAVEFLRHTGARIEEMLEISHHAVIQYRLPTTGEIVPLLQIAPSKTDQERVVLVSPELADVLATIIRRVRGPRTGAIPLLSAYDYAERVWNPPSPLLFQWDRGRERSRMSGEFIRSALGEVLAFIGLTDSTGQPPARPFAPTTAPAATSSLPTAGSPPPTVMRMVMNRPVPVSRQQSTRTWGRPVSTADSSSGVQMSAIANRAVRPVLPRAGRRVPPWAQLLPGTVSGW